MGSVQGPTTRSAGKIDMDAVRALIAGYLQIDVRHVTDNAHLSHDLGADGLDRLELLIRLEDLTGVEITHNELDQIEYVGDLVHYLGEKQLYLADGHKQGHCDGGFRPASI